MFTTFIIILVIGLGGFLFVLKNAMSRPTLSADASLKVAATKPVPVPEPIVFSSDPAAEIVEHKAVIEALQIKVQKLEQMLEEKNRLITGLQLDLKSVQGRDQQIEELKDILQGQIDEFKQQNKSLKAEIARLSGENLDLQTRLFASGKEPGERAAGLTVRPITLARDEVDPAKIKLNDVFSS